MVVMGALGCGLFSDPAFTWRTVAPGTMYTCGLSTSSEAYCWGGHTGISISPAPAESLIPNSPFPLKVPGGLRFASLAMGSSPVCALTETGAAYCWGENATGELGDSSFVAKRTPVVVRGGMRWRTLSAGGSNACGITTDGKGYCWGNQFRGMSGNGQLSGTTTIPTAIGSNLQFESIYAGSTSCALTGDGDAYCWGVNDFGVGGDGGTPRAGLDISTPSLVTGGRAFVSLALGLGHVCGLDIAGDAYCWGHNAAGQLGDNSSTSRSTPTLVSGGLKWRQLTAGGAHVCGIATDTGLYCWGSNADGQFGNGEKGQGAAAPLLIEKPTRFSKIAAGYSGTCGTLSSGEGFCWGRGDRGQLGSGANISSSIPVRLATPR